MKNKIKIPYSLKTLFKYISPYKKTFFASILMIIISNFAMVLAPNIEGMVTNAIIKDLKNIASSIPGAHIQIEKIISIISFLLIIYIIKTFSQMFGMFFITESIQNTMRDLRNDCIKKINSLSVKTINSHPKGDILSRITNDVDTISTAMQQTFVNIISGIMTVTFAFIMMFRVNLLMTLCVILFIPISYFIIRKIASISQKSFDMQQKSLGDLSANITESFTGYNEIILYGKQDEYEKKFEKINSELKLTAFKAQFLSYFMSPALSFITYISIGLISVIGGFYCINGTISVGQLQAFIRFIWQVNEPLSQVSQLSSQIQSSLSAMSRIHEFLEYNNEYDVEKKDISINRCISFENVEFGYGDKKVLKGISFEVNKGETVAIVGPTGSGKTTIVNLLMRFYDSQKGKIEIDGIDIKTINREKLRERFGMVLQDTWLFSGSIKDNILFSNPNASETELKKACKLANLEEFISSLPHGYDTKIDEEADNISQGEKQLLTIARAILKNPDILILDEATSSIDTKTEKNIQGAMDHLMNGRTSFIIAHRLSTIKNADKIIVLKDGNIIESGNHDELLDKKGFYADLYNAQFSSL